MRVLPIAPVLIVTAALCITAGHDASAAACCGSSYGMGSRLAPSETSAVTLLARNSLGTGSWDDAGRIHAARILTHELRLDAAGQLRVNHDLQLGASAPFLSTTRLGLKDSSHGWGPGDASVFARYDLIPVGGRGWFPGVGLTLGMTLPTGRAPARSTDRLGADVTGAGLWEIRPGIAFERSWLNGWFVVVTAGLALRLPTSDASGRSLQYAPRFSATAAAGPTLWRKLAIAGGLTHEREAALLVNNTPVPRGDRHRTALLGLVSWEVDEHWTLVASSQADIPLARMGRNEPTAASLTFGIRRVWLDYE